MKCNELKNKLYFYAAGEIEPGEEADITAHLDKCPGCRKTLQEFKTTLNLIGKYSTAAPEKNWNYFAEKTMEKIHNSKPYRFLKSAAAVSFLLCVFAIGYFHYAGKSPAGSGISSEADELAYYLTDFDIPELNQGI